MTTSNQYISNLKAQIESVQSCEDLRAISGLAAEMYREEIEAIQAQIATIQPMLSLLSLNIVDLPGVIKFLKDFVEIFLTPHLAPHIALMAKLAEQIADAQEVVAAISAAADRIGECSIEP